MSASLVLLTRGRPVPYHGNRLYSTTPTTKEPEMHEMFTTLQPYIVIFLACAAFAWLRSAFAK